MDGFGFDDTLENGFKGCGAGRERELGPLELLAFYVPVDIPISPVRITAIENSIRSARSRLHSIVIIRNHTSNFIRFQCVFVVSVRLRPSY